MLLREIDETGLILKCHLLCTCGVVELIKSAHQQIYLPSNQFENQFFTYQK